MAEIATYRCSNYRCRMTMRICKDFPVWRQDAPLAIRSVSPKSEHLPFVERFRSEGRCDRCGLVSADIASQCRGCGSQNFSSEQMGKKCAQCGAGTFTMSNLVVR